MTTTIDTPSPTVAAPAEAARGPTAALARPRAAAWLAYGDSMRVLGVLAVIVGHVCDMPFFQPGISRPHWWAANIADAASRWAVPIFIMLSGALLLHPAHPETPSQFYRRRVARLGVAIVFWSAFFMLFSVYYTKWVSGQWSEPNNVWKNLLLGQPYPHLHFVFRLGGLYLITPLLRVYVRHARLRLRVRMLIAIFAISMANSLAAPFVNSQMTGFMIMWPFLGYYLAGDVMRAMPVSRRVFAWSAGGFVATIALVAGITGLLVPPGVRPTAYPSMDMIMFDFLNPARVAMAFCAWNILKYLFSRIDPRSPVQRAMAALAPLTLGIYLVHPLFRELLWTEGLLFSRPSFWLGMPAAVAAVSIAAVAVTWVLYRIPGVRKIVS